MHNSVCRSHRLVRFLGLGLCLILASAGALAQQAVPTLLKFGDFYQLPVGPQGLLPSARLLAADQQPVSLVGWMVEQEQPLTHYFLLTARPVRLSEQADGPADDLPPTTVLVRLPQSSGAMPLVHQQVPVELSGRLSVGRAVEADGRVSWIQLQLPFDPGKQPTRP